MKRRRLTKRRVARRVARVLRAGLETDAARGGGSSTLALHHYLNSVWLAAQVGLWAWCGTPFDEANRLLRDSDLSGEDLAAQARVYRQERSSSGTSTSAS